MIQQERRRCPRCRQCQTYQEPRSDLVPAFTQVKWGMSQARFSLAWEKVPNVSSIPIIGEYGIDHISYEANRVCTIQPAGSPLWLAGQEVCYECAAFIPRKFHYSSYWGTWSRVLMIGRPVGQKEDIMVALVGKELAGYL